MGMNFLFFTKQRLLWMIGSIIVFLAPQGAFSLLTRKIYVPENAPAGSVIADLPDYVNSGVTIGRRKNFKLFDQKMMSRRLENPSGNWFHIDEDLGRVTVNRKLDREELCGKKRHCTVHLQIYVKSLSKMIRLIVEIEDVNEHPPTFPVRQVYLNASEAAEIGDRFNLDQYKATDRDASYNSSISYSIEPSSDFTLVQYKDEMGTTHLTMELVHELDYETDSYYRLTLSAEDSGPPSLRSRIPLQVQVIDENDNPPIFDKQKYTAVVPENTLGRVTQVHAKDADSGLAGSVNFFISGQNRKVTSALFDVNRVTGEVTLKKKLDRESSDIIEVFIDARDLGEPPLISRTQLVVHVSDVNDNPPIITISCISLSKGNTVYLPETLPRRSHFAYVNVNDFDSDQNGQVQIVMKAFAAGSGEDASDMFRLTDDRLLGLNAELDEEKQSRYRIVFNATDGGVVPRWTVEELDVVVLDENDNPPRFHQAVYDISVSEGEAVGAELVQLRATDLDASSSSSPLMLINQNEIVPSTNGDINYYLDPGTVGTFAIDPRSGVITLVTPLDREQISSWEFTATVIDRGLPQSLKSTCKVKVTVTDINDNAPVFMNPFHDGTTVYATILRDDVITRIQATDYDVGRNGKIGFLLFSVDDVIQTNHVNTSLFLLDNSNGDLRLNMSYGNLTQSLGRHVVVVQARDYGFPPIKIQRTINVIVTDDVVLPSRNMIGQHQDEEAFPTMITIIIASLASLILILIIVAIFAIFRCRKRSKESNVEASNSVLDSTLLRGANQQTKYSAPLPRGDATQMSSNRTQDEHFHSMTCDSTSTDVTHLSKNDVVIIRDVNTDQRLAKATSSIQNSLKRKDTMANSSNFDGNGKDGGKDEDSGRGDSDAGAGSPHFQGSTKQRHFGTRCNEQCLQYGHSDRCWMPTGEETCRRSFRSMVPNNIHLDHHKTSHWNRDGEKKNVDKTTASVPLFWPSTKTGMGLTSLYSKNHSHVYVTPSAWMEENRDEDVGSAVDSKLAASSAASTTTGYVTEPEIV